MKGCWRVASISLVTLLRQFGTEAANSTESNFQSSFIRLYLLQSKCAKPSKYLVMLGAQTSSVFVSILLKTSHSVCKLSHSQVLFSLKQEMGKSLCLSPFCQRLFTLKLLFILGEPVLAAPMIGLPGAELVRDILNPDS